MSKVAIQGDPSGSGTFTIAAPNSNSNANINLPTVTGGEFIVSNASGNVGIGTSSPSARLSVSDGTTRIDLSPFGGTGFIGTQSNHTTSIIANNAEQGRFTSSGLFQFNSGYGSVATAFGCRAWVNFNGSGGASIRASGNVSSVTRNGTGDYTVNFATAMPDANYSAVGSSRNSTTRLTIFSPQHAGVTDPFTTTTARFRTSDDAGTVNDSDIVSVAIFR